MLPHASPPAAPRIVALDVLRGFALCGVLVADVPLLTSFGGALPPSAPTLHDPGGWLALFVHQRFLPILSLLFGVGFSLAAASAVRRGAHPRAVLLRRLLALLVIGLVHQLWHPGDAVAVYAAVGLLVLRAVFAPLGRLALTNHVLATPVLLAAGRVLDLPHSRAWDRVLLLVGGTLAVQWVFSTLWLRRFPHGPLELLRRRVTRQDGGPRLRVGVVSGLTVAVVNVAAVAALVAAAGAAGPGTGGPPAGPVLAVAAAMTGACTPHRAGVPRDAAARESGPEAGRCDQR